MKANKWTESSMAQYFRFHIDGEGSDDGISDQINEVNRMLSHRFKVMAQSITSEDIQNHLDKVIVNDPDWLAHLDIVLEMAQANPSALKTDHVKQLVDITREAPVIQSVISKVENIRPQYAAGVLEQLGMKAVA